MKKLISFVLCIVLALGISAPAFAGETPVDYCRVKIVVDGATIVPKDANGNPVEPFILNGTTYLPVRSVANALGLDVAWESGMVLLTSGAERTAAIGNPVMSSRRVTVPMGGQDTKVTLDGEVLNLKDAAGSPVSPIISEGVTYLPVRAIADALNVPVLWDGDTATVYLGKAIEWKVVKETTANLDGTESVNTYVYDKQGNLIQEKDIWGDETWESYVYTYDTQGRLISKDYSFPSDYDGRIRCIPEKFTYDENGNLIKKELWEDGEVIDQTVYTYDAAGNLLIEDNGYEKTVYTYDAAGRCLKEETTLGDSWGYTVAYTYDAQGRKRSVVEKEVHGELQHTYDERGNELTFSYVGDEFWESTVCTYDERNNKITEHNESAHGVPNDVTYTYDAFNNCIRETDISEQHNYVHIYEYDDGNLLQSHTGSSFGAPFVVLKTYIYDAYGNLTQVNAGARIWQTYEYTPIYK